MNFKENKNNWLEGSQNDWENFVSGTLFLFLTVCILTMLFKTFALPKIKNFLNPATQTSVENKNIEKLEEQKQKELIQQREAENKRQKELQRQQEEQRLEQEKIKQQQEKERIYNEAQNDLF